MTPEQLEALLKQLAFQTETAARQAETTALLYDRLVFLEQTVGNLLNSITMAGAFVLKGESVPLLVKPFLKKAFEDMKKTAQLLLGEPTEKR